MKTLLKILLLCFPILSYSQDIKKVSGVTDTNVKKVSGVSDTNIKKVNGVTFNNVSFSGILDTYPNANFAYSVRRLDADYAGSAIRVRRASDSATQDIGFETDGDLDVAAISSFCSGTTGYVTIWYDQSGNGYNFTSEDNDNFVIYQSGAVLVGANGKPRIQSSNLACTGCLSTSSISMTEILNLEEHYSIVSLANMTGSSVSYLDMTSGTNVLNLYFFYGVQGFYLEDGFGGNVEQYSSEEVSGDQIVEHRTANGDYFVYSQGAEVLNVADDIIEYVNSGPLLLTVSGHTAYQEIIVYNTAQTANRAAIYTNTAAYF